MRKHHLIYKNGEQIKKINENENIIFDKSKENIFYSTL